MFDFSEQKKNCNMAFDWRKGLSAAWVSANKLILAGASLDQAYRGNFILAGIGAAVCAYTVVMDAQDAGEIPSDKMQKGGQHQRRPSTHRRCSMLPHAKQIPASPPVQSSAFSASCRRLSP